MISISPESTGNPLIISASGKLTDSDYKDVLIPRLEAVIHEHGKARLLLDMGDEFHGWEPMAAWDDARFGLAHRNDFEKMGVLGGPKWVDWSLKIGALFIGGELKNFPSDQRAEALRWVKS
jgi:hypothetical protein